MKDEDKTKEQLVNNWSNCVTYPYDSMIPRELVALADKRMYESKRSGRSAVSAGVS